MRRPRPIVREMHRRACRDEIAANDVGSDAARQEDRAAGHVLEISRIEAQIAKLEDVESKRAARRTSQQK